jgi:hypothetical protein
MTNSNGGIDSGFTCIYFILIVEIRVITPKMKETPTGCSKNITTSSDPWSSLETMD